MGEISLFLSSSNWDIVLRRVSERSLSLEVEDTSIVSFFTTLDGQSVSGLGTRKTFRCNELLTYSDFRKCIRLRDTKCFIKQISRTIKVPFKE